MIPPARIPGCGCGYDTTGLCKNPDNCLNKPADYQKVYTKIWIVYTTVQYENAQQNIAAFTNESMARNLEKELDALPYEERYIEGYDSFDNCNVDELELDKPFDLNLLTLKGK